MKKYFAIGLGVMALLVFWIWISSPILATFTGIGEVSVPATSATITFSVTASDLSSQAAVAAVNSKLLDVEGILKSNGIAEQDIAISQITMIPAALVVAGSSGYQASLSVSAKTAKVTEINALIASLYASGVYVVSQPVLAVEAQDQLESQAVEKALVDAKKQANSFALKNLKFFKKIVAVNQQSSASTSTTTSKADVALGAQSAEAAQNGVFKMVKAVSVSYKLW